MILCAKPESALEISAKTAPISVACLRASAAAALAQPTTPVNTSETD